MRSMKVILLIVLLSISIGFICATVVSTVSNVNIEPNPMEKFTTVSFSVIKNANITITIETPEGDIISTLCNVPMNIGNYSYTWNRMGDDGDYVPGGTYKVVVNYGTKYTSIKKTLILK